MNLCRLKIALSISRAELGKEGCLSWVSGHLLETILSHPLHPETRLTLTHINTHICTNRRQRDMWVQVQSNVCMFVCERANTSGPPRLGKHKRNDTHKREKRKGSERVEKRKAGADRGMEIQVSQWIKSGCVTQQEKGLSARGGREQQDKEKVCKVSREAAL